MTLQTEGIGYPDLDELMKNPCDLEFVIGNYDNDQYSNISQIKVFR